MERRVQQGMRSVCVVGRGRGGVRGGCTCRAQKRLQVEGETTTSLSGSFKMALQQNPFTHCCRG